MGQLGQFGSAVYGKLAQLKITADAHSADVTGAIHGAVSAATVNMIVRRDASGRADIVAPAAADSTTKIPTTAWVQTEIAGAGTVTNVASGTGLTGGPITGTGTLSLANTTVVAGAYTFANITVDAQGRLTAASSGVVATSVFGRTGAVTALTGDYAAFYPENLNPETIAGAWTYSGTNVHSGGSLRFNDNIKLLMGTGSDAEIYFDAGDLIVDLEPGGTLADFIVKIDDGTATPRQRLKVSATLTGGCFLGYGAETTAIGTTSPHTTGNLTGGRVLDISDNLSPIGLAVWKHINIGASVDVARNFWQARVRNVVGSNVALNVTNDSTIPAGAWLMVQAKSGTMTITEGAGVTIARYLGSGTPATGTASLALGGWCYLLKVDNTNFDVVQGVGLT